MPSDLFFNMKKIIVANLKMNPQSAKETGALFSEIKKTASKLRGVDTVFCPPFVYLSQLGRETSKLPQNVKIGAQDVFWKDNGAYTGEISPTQLKKLGVKYVIIGHSERREHLQETDELINKKIRSALKAGLKVILCVGEKEREEDSLPVIIKEELNAGLSGVPKKFSKNIIIAYEPIWAIGSGRADKPENLTSTIIYIRRIILGIFGKKVAHEIAILYGGSVNEKNAKSFLEIDGISGLLVGGASLDARKFGAILKEASFIK